LSLERETVFDFCSDRMLSTRLSIVALWSFPVAALRIWNCLHVISTPSLQSFNKPLLFSRSFPSKFIVPYSCDFVDGLAAFGLSASA